jgi:hypothetical protein
VPIVSRHKLTDADRRAGGKANPFTAEEADRGRALGRASMVRSGHLARAGAKGRERIGKRPRSYYVEIGRKGAAARWARTKP